MTILLLLFALTVELDTVNLPVNSEVKITFAPATAKADLKREGTVTRVKIEVDSLRTPAAPMNTYVVWAVSPEGLFENLGELQMNRNRGEFDGTTRLSQLGLLITAEPHYMVDRPSSTAAWRSQNIGGETRRVTIPFEIGQYDYANLKPSAPAVNPYVVQARSALQIAQNAGVEQVAEVDFRHARVALGAMEELITRAAPLDILLPAAHEAIRWAQKSVTAARDKGTEKELQDAKSEVVALRAEKQQIDARIRQLTQEQAAAVEQIRTLQAAVGSANSEKDAAEARAQNVERKLDELNRKQDELQGLLKLDLRNDFYNDSGLTEAGRDALIRIHNISEVLPGPIRLEGNAPENAIKAATEFLILAGTPQDRITTRR
jgi:hypothetical protein